LLAAIAVIANTPTAYAADTGDCTENRWSSLSDKIGYTCKGNGKGESCHIKMSCADLAFNRDRFMECAATRETMMKECFKGGDSTHRDAVDNEWRAANRCVEVYKNPEHKPPC
jgi:hypothetical protein